MGEHVKNDEEEQKRLRMEYLEIASVVNTILERRYFPAVIEALKNKSNEKFEKVCNDAQIPPLARPLLWKTLNDVYKARKNNNPWMTGA